MSTEEDNVDASTMSEELRNIRVLSRNCCIYRVSKEIRELNRRAYTQYLSIGPYHHGKPELKAIEEHKKRYLHDFLLVTGVSLEDYMGLIEKKETRLRDCYAEPVELSSAYFLKMVLLDAIFIIMVLFKASTSFERLVTSEQRLVSTNDRLFEKHILMEDLICDMIMLENQLPFFILEDIFSLSKIQDCLMGVTMIKLAHDFLNCFSQNIKTDIEDQNFWAYSAERLLHLFTICFTKTGSEWKPERKKVSTLRAPRIEGLCLSGVSLRCGSKENIFDIRFEDGILEILPLVVSDRTEMVLRNLVAYERCNDLEPVFADYIMLMDQLVNGPRDFQLLVKKKIIQHFASGEQTSAMFNKLNTQSSIDPEYFAYSNLIDNLNQFN